MNLLFPVRLRIRTAWSPLVAGWFLTGWIGLLLPLAQAQPESATRESSTPPARDEAMQMIQDAYRKTQQADSVAEFEEIIRLADRASTANLPEAHAEYVSNLLGWAFNRRGEAFVEQAAAAAERGDRRQAAELDERALDDFETAIEHDPDRWKAIHNRGVSYAVAGRYDEAVEDFTRVTELQEDYANAWFNRAEIRYELKQYEAALQDYNQAIRLDPSNAATYTSRGHTYFQLGQFNEAISDYNQAVRIEPNNASAIVDRGDAYRSLGDWQQAAQDYRRAINLDNQHSRAYQSAAWLMATAPDPRYRNPSLAVQSAERAVELQEEPDFRYLDTLAAAYANAGQFERALETLAEALQAAPENEQEALQRRQQLYQRQQPYRQGAENRAAR